MEQKEIERLLNKIRNRASQKNFVRVGIAFGDVVEMFDVIDILKFGAWWKVTVVAPEGWWRGQCIDLPISQAQFEAIAAEVT